MGFWNTDNLFLYIFQILYFITAIGLVFVVISENRNPLKTISWVLILLLLPIVGLIVYYFFGEDNRKRRLISRKMKKKLNRKAISGSENFVSVSLLAEHKGLIQLLAKLDECPLYEGNKITFYSDGANMFEALFHEIEKAQKHVHIQYYIFLDDAIGNKVKDALEKKVKEGVEVRVLYDDVGSWRAKNSFFGKMEEAGILVEPFLKVKFPLLTSRVNYRNHRKVVVIDGEVGFMGGMNIADRYMTGINNGVWRDCHFKIEGKAVHGLQTSFATDWYASRTEFLVSNKYYPLLESRGNTLMQIATSGPTGQFKAILQGFFQAITNAKESVYIQTPYFIPNDVLLLAIQAASIRGVDVRVMLPMHSDTKLAHVASLSYIRDLLNAKVSVYLFKSGFIHSKLSIIDDNLTICGSANMDVRSFEHNFEIEGFIYDQETATKAKKIFFDDLENCELVNEDEWESRSRLQRFNESVMRMFTPLL